MEYAGFWLRLVAYLIDWFLVEVAVWAITLAIAGGAGEQAFAEMAAIVGLLVGLLYWAGMESSAKQATLGKLAVGIRVTDLEGRRISFLRALGRTLAKLLSSIILMIGYLMAGWTQRKQALHDMIAGTLVVRKVSLPPPVARERMSGSAPDRPLGG